MKKWHFSSTDICSNYKFNQSMTDFDKYGISGVIRENIQNSSDAKLDDKNPVKIDINLKKISTKDLFGINCLNLRIQSLKAENPYSKIRILNMKEVIKNKECNIMTIEDSNTKGLSGATENRSPYIAYAYSKGFHAEDDDSNKEGKRGGSHGIGKIASNAASNIATMYFATKDDLGEEYLGGTCEFIDHNYEGKNFLGTGYFANLKGNKFEAYKNENIDSIFSKRTRGLKVIIPFIKDDYCDRKEIVRSVCDNFFISILNGGLEINVFNEKIHIENLENIILNEIYYEQNIKEYNRNSNLSPLYYKTFKTQKKIDIEILDGNDESYYFEMYLNMIEGLRTGKYCIFRTNGMKVVEKSIKGHSTSAFNVVLISKGATEDTFLKSLENEAHTQFSANHIIDKNTKKSAIKFLNNLDNKISEIIFKKLEELNPTDGKVDTSDIIYEMNYNFKKIEKENKSIVRISEKGDRESKKTNVKSEIEELIISKSSTGDYEISSNGEIIGKLPNSRTEGGSNCHNTNSSSYKNGLLEKKDSTKRTIIKKVDGIERKFIKLASGTAKRKIVKDQEKLLLDLTGIEEMKKISKCSLKISAIDGEGNEIDDFIITDNYKIIKEENEILYLSSNKKEIKEVTLKNRKVNLILHLAENCNKNLKFIYEVVI